MSARRRKRRPTKAAANHSLRKTGDNRQAATRPGAVKVSLVAAGAVVFALFLVQSGWLPFAPRSGQNSISPGQRDSSRVAPEAVGYIDPIACAGCHQAIWDQYRETGMGQSFARMRSAVAVADFEGNNSYYHRASDSTYRMYRDGEAYYMERTQRGWNRRETNRLRKRIEYFIGSAYKARTFATRSSQGELVQLPVTWYTERGGFWAMSPGYDRPDHDGFTRRIKFDCMFCHNAYVAVASGEDGFDADPIYPDRLPEGIDCQRCHGPGRTHLEALANRESESAVRASIVNPARLEPERRQEVCYQCHLQSTSFRLPYASQRPGRGVFSYRPGERLAEYILHFDHAADSGYDDKFEIAHSAYRLRKSPCFQESGGALECTACHNPHRHLERDAREYGKACLGCHGQSAVSLPSDQRHATLSDCVACHMAQRRTDDVIHAVMTDHYIRSRHPDRDLLAPRQEIIEGQGIGYRGEVALYYPPQLPAEPASELDLAVAQVEAGTDLESGLPRLRRAIERTRPNSYHYYYELAEAYFKARNVTEAFQWWEEALRRKPDFLPALRNYGKELAKEGRIDHGIEVLRRALAVRQDDPRSLHDLALAYLLKGDSQVGLATLRRALAADPDEPRSHNLLATQLYAAGDPSGAESAFREAIRLDPRFGTAHANLASLLVAEQRLDEAEYHFRRAVELSPEYSKGRLDYAVFLADHGRSLDQALHHLNAAVEFDPESVDARVGLGYVLSLAGQLDQAEQELKFAIRREPGNSAAHIYLAGVFERKHDLEQARTHYARALHTAPESGLAHYGLGAVLAKQGEIHQALHHLRRAAATSNRELSRIASDAVRALEGAPAAETP